MPHLARGRKLRTLGIAPPSHCRSHPVRPFCLTECRGLMPWTALHPGCSVVEAARDWSVSANVAISTYALYSFMALDPPLAGLEGNRIPEVVGFASCGITTLGKAQSDRFEKRKAAWHTPKSRFASSSGPLFLRCGEEPEWHRFNAELRDFLLE